jgi:hypothetical protein
MFCETPEELAMLDKLMAEYPDGNPSIMNMNVWMWFNKREEYIKTMDECREKFGDNPELISVDDERLQSIYPKDIKVVPSPVFLEQESTEASFSNPDQ